MSAPEQTDWNMSKIAVLLKDAADAITDWFNEQPCAEPVRTRLTIDELYELAETARSLVPQPEAQPEVSADIIVLDSWRHRPRR